MKKYYADNTQKWIDRQSTLEHKDRKNNRQRIKYKTNEEYRQGVIQRSKQYRIDNPMAKRTQDLRKYGMTPEDYDNMIAKQGNRCAICGTDVPDKKGLKYFYVDHSHKTGSVRGLLCYRCNLGIGLFEDDVQVLDNAIKYLERNNT